MMEYEILTKKLEEEIPKDMISNFFDDESLDSNNQTGFTRGKDVPFDYNEKIDGPYVKS